MGKYLVKEDFIICWYDKDKPNRGQTASSWEAIAGVELEVETGLFGKIKQVKFNGENVGNNPDYVYSVNTFIRKNCDKLS